MRIVEELRELVAKAKASDEFLAIDDDHIELLTSAANALEQMELQKNSAIAVSRKLQAERERLKTRVEFALQGIRDADAVLLSDANEEDSGSG